MSALLKEQETIPGWGQIACLLKEEHLAVLYGPGEALLNQARGLPLSWNGLFPVPYASNVFFQKTAPTPLTNNTVSKDWQG